MVVSVVAHAVSGAALAACLSLPCIANARLFAQLAKHTAVIRTPEMQQLVQHMQQAWCSHKHKLGPDEDIRPSIEWWKSGAPLTPAAIKATANKPAFVFFRPAEELVCRIQIQAVIQPLLLANFLQILPVFGTTWVDSSAFSIAGFATAVAAHEVQHRAFSKLGLSQPEASVLARIVLTGDTSWKFGPHGELSRRSLSWLTTEDPPMFFYRLTTSNK